MVDLKGWKKEKAALELRLAFRLENYQARWRMAPLLGSPSPRWVELEESEISEISNQIEILRQRIKDHSPP